MSNPPPDRPTEPQRAVQHDLPVEERVRSPDPVLLRLEDAVDSLRTGIMIVGVIAVAALGVGIYSLVSQDDGGDASRSGLASDSRVSKLDDRVDSISRQVQELRGAEGDDDELGDRVEALEKTVKELAERPTPGDATEAVKELSDRIDDIAADVEQLKSRTAP